jgi:hypothetical protein
MFALRDLELGKASITTSRYDRAERPRVRQVGDLVLRHHDMFALSDLELAK